MAKKQTPITQNAANALTELEETVAAIQSYEAHEAECVRQLEVANRVAEEWSRELNDTQSLLRAQREKLDRECNRLHMETNTLERKHGMLTSRFAESVVMRGERNPF